MNKHLKNKQVESNAAQPTPEISRKSLGQIGEWGDFLFRSLPVGATEPQGYLVPAKQRWSWPQLWGLHG